VSRWLPTASTCGTRLRLQTLRQAIEGRCKLRLQYRDLALRTSRRTVRPLGCFYWDAVWVLGAWCEMRGEFRNFRVDRIEELAVSGERFRDKPGRTLADLLRPECANDKRLPTGQGGTLGELIRGAAAGFAGERWWSKRVRLRP